MARQGTTQPADGEGLLGTGEDARTTQAPVSLPLPCLLHLCSLFSAPPPKVGGLLSALFSFFPLSRLDPEPPRAALPL